MRKKEKELFGRCAGKLLLTLEPDPLSQNTEVEGGCFLLLVYLLESIWSDVSTLLLESLLGSLRKAADNYDFDIYFVSFLYLFLPHLILHG